MAQRLRKNGSVRRTRTGARWRSFRADCRRAAQIRLERLRGFGAAPGMLVTCGCARLEFADGTHGILIAAAESRGRTMPLAERLQRLVEGIEQPIAAFTRDGMLVGASDAVRALLGFGSLAEAGLDEARDDALREGRAETAVGFGHMVLQRVGSGSDVGLVGLIAPALRARQRLPGQRQSGVAPAAEQPMPDYEQPAISGEAPAEFALIDEFADEPPHEASSAPRRTRVRAGGASGGAADTRLRAASDFRRGSRRIRIDRRSFRTDRR